MQTSRFWQAIDRIGTTGAALRVWRMELGDEIESALPYLRAMPDLAEVIPDPDDRRHRLRVYPIDDETCIAESDEFPAHRAPLTLPAPEVTHFVPNWEALRPALATELGFVGGTFKTQSDPNTQQLGIVQPPRSATLPVYLHLPGGAFTDYSRFVEAVQTLPACMLLVPTARWLDGEINRLASRHAIRLEPLAERFVGRANERASILTITSDSSAQIPASRKAKLSAILNVQPDWSWERVKIRLTASGTLIASYGDERNEHRFVRNPQSGSFPQLFRAILELSHRGNWKNPHSSDPDYEAKSRAFSRLREQLRMLIPIPAEPFHRRNRGWEPKFTVELDGALNAVRERRFAATSANRRSRESDDPDELEK
jgi:hypothetical protein